jgi:organic hydroperoxide reductase OsmC/OhrA
MDFETTVEWRGEYPARLSCQNGMEIDYSSPIEFGGVKGPLTPEDAFIASANMCFQIVFRRISSDLGVGVRGYRCRAVGKLETVEGIRKFVTITLNPEITLEPGSDVSRIEKAIEATKRKCLVTNSMAAEIIVIPRLTQGAAEKV